MSTNEKQQKLKTLYLKIESLKTAQSRTKWASIFKRNNAKQKIAKLTLEYYKLIETPTDDDVIECIKNQLQVAGYKI